MSQFRSLELAIELATRQRDGQARKHAQAQRNLEFAHNQMAQLKGYAGETDARWTGGGLQQLTAEMVQHHYQFRARLEGAVELQVGVIANMQAQVQKAHAVLLQAEYKLAGLRQVLGSRRAVVDQKLQRREQRATDEFAAQSHVRKLVEKSLGESL